MTDTDDDPNMPSTGEYRLTDTYAAMRTPYPLTVPIFFSCDHFRVEGETIRRGLDQLAVYSTDPVTLADVEAWTLRFCQGRPYCVAKTIESCLVVALDLLDAIDEAFIPE